MVSRRPRHAPEASPKRPGSLTKPDCGTERSLRPASINFWSNFDVCAGPPKRDWYWFLQCFVDVGRFAHRMLVERKNLAKTVVLGSKIEAGGVPGTLGRASLGAKTAKSGEKARSKCLRGFRKFISGRERGNFERESATVSGQDARPPRSTRSHFRLGGAPPSQNYFELSIRRF